MERILFVFVATFGFSFAKEYTIDTHTCSSVVAVDYTVERLNCVYQGAGFYHFEGPESVVKVTFDRLTTDGILYFKSNYLEVVEVQNGQMQLCKNIVVNEKVKVLIGNKLCDKLPASTIDSNLKTTTETPLESSTSDSTTLGSPSENSSLGWIYSIITLIAVLVILGVSVLIFRRRKLLQFCQKKKKLPMTRKLCFSERMMLSRMKHNETAYDFGTKV